MEYFLKPIMPRELRPIENMSLPELQAKKDSVSGAIKQRHALVDRIGTGEIQTMSSIPASHRVGEVRRKVKLHIERLDRRLTRVDSELATIDQARNYRDDLELKQSQIDDI